MGPACKSIDFKLTSDGDSHECHLAPFYGTTFELQHITFEENSDYDHYEVKCGRTENKKLKGAKFELSSILFSKGTSVKECETGCRTESWCKSFIFHKENNNCILSGKDASDADGLEDDRSYDYYHCTPSERKLAALPGSSESPNDIAVTETPSFVVDPVLDFAAAWMVEPATEVEKPPKIPPKPEPPELEKFEPEGAEEQYEGGAMCKPKNRYQT